MRFIPSRLHFKPRCRAGSKNRTCLRSQFRRDRRFAGKNGRKLCGRNAEPLGRNGKRRVFKNLCEHLAWMLRRSGAAAPLAAAAGSASGTSCVMLRPAGAAA